MKYIDVMPLENDYQEFKKYLLKLRKQYNLKLKWNDTTKALSIDDTLVYFRDYIHCMCYLEGFKRGRDKYGNRSR